MQIIRTHVSEKMVRWREQISGVVKRRWRSPPPDGHVSDRAAALGTLADRFAGRPVETLGTLVAFLRRRVRICEHHVGS